VTVTLHVGIIFSSLFFLKGSTGFTGFSPQTVSCQSCQRARNKIENPIDEVNDIAIGEKSSME